MKVILLVEDSKFLRIANARALGKAGFRVITATDGEEALKAAFEQTPDLILLDMLLPKMSGVEVLRTLRKNPSTAKTPVVVMSSLAKSNEPKLRREGADAFFEKSNLDLGQGIDAFIQMLRTFLERASEKQKVPFVSGALPSE